MKEFELEETLGITEEDKERFENFSKDPQKLNELHKSLDQMGIASKVSFISNVSTYGRNFMEAICKEKFKEIQKLHDMLTEADIPHVFGFDPDNVGFYVGYEGKHEICDAVEHMFSYGNDEDKLELMGMLTEEELLTDTVAGHLTAEDVFNRIKNDFENGGI